MVCGLGYVIPEQWHNLISKSRAIAHAVTENYPGKKHSGFNNLDDAKEYLEKNGCKDYYISTDTEPTNGFGDRRDDGGFYAVMNGRNIGVYSTYSGGAQPEVHQYSHSCHKKYGSYEEAQMEIERYHMMQKNLKGSSKEGGFEELIEGLSSLTLDRST
ncbi:hypothetical protein BDW59DRAFT_163569 [Aspergillus cavernicola]|uniref:Ribonuclease H1 N-terminal domain-containing protein n=1 Tax=Aspergillus cavernicola TaxID=176166 RepID=A0ABR4I4T5_9EURO